MSAMKVYAEDLAARTCCKLCGAESLAGIGYAADGFVGPLPAPANGCPNPHAMPAIGAWCPVTRGFYEGGRYVTVDELAPGDVFRWGTYSGYVMEDERPAFPYVSTCRDLICTTTILRLARRTVVEVSAT